MNSTTAIPPVLRARQFHWLPLFAGVALGGALAVLFWFNPSAHSFYPQCTFHQLTGLDCPGCGGLRATHQMLHGNVRAAFALNPLLFFIGPVVAWLLFAAAYAQKTGREIFLWRHNTLCVWLLTLLVICFGIVRNLPTIVKIIKTANP